MTYVTKQIVAVRLANAHKKFYFAHILLCFARLTQQMAVISLYNMQLLVFVMEKQYV